MCYLKNAIKIHAPSHAVYDLQAQECDDHTHTIIDKTKSYTQRGRPLEILKKCCFLDRKNSFLG